MASRKLKHGAWTWERQEPGPDGCEIWRLSDECVEALGAVWFLKNYGDADPYLVHERDTFTGWRFVGSGPLGPKHADVHAAASYARVALNQRVLARKASLKAQIDRIEALLCS